MDMQDKLIIFHRFSGRKDEIILDKIKYEEIVFDFNEYEPISIKLESTKYEILIECVNYRCDGNYFIADNNILKLENEKVYDISANNAEEDLSYIPARYCLFIRNGNNERLTFFEVTRNRNLTENGLENIIEKLNTFINGLSIDFFRSKKINNIIYEGDTSEYTIFEILSINKSKIIMHVNNIISQFIQNIKNEYAQEWFEKKQNQYTLRKNSMKKIEYKNYNLKKSICNNSIENTLLKMYLIKIKKIIENTNFNVKKIREENSIKSYNIKKKLNENYNNLKNNRLSLFDKNFIQNENKSLVQERKYYDEWQKKLDTWHDSYKASKSYINKLINTEELKIVNDLPKTLYSISFEMNSDYVFFKKLYIELVKQYNNKHKKNAKSLFNDKKTFALFELYGFILIQNILKELGFKYIESEKDVFSFHSDSEFIYVNQNITVKVQYDHFCNSYYNKSAKIGDIISANSANCKPDYIISIYDENDNLKKAVIVEMKYRYLKYLRDRNGRSETGKTLDDYRQLAIKIEEYPYYKNIIGDVMIIYPEVKEQCFIHNSSYYIGINSELDFDKSISYKTLKERIQKQISDAFLL